MKDIVKIGYGGLCHKKDVNLIKDTFEKLTKEKEEYLKDENGLYSAFLYELGNHEYCITYDDQEVFSALDIDIKTADKKTVNIYIKARAEYLKNAEW